MTDKTEQKQCMHENLSDSKDLQDTDEIEILIF